MAKPLPPDKSLQVLIADRDDPTKFHELTGWQSYAVVNDMLGGIQRFNAVLAATPGMRELVGTGGQRCAVIKDGDLQFWGILDERSMDINVQGRDLEITGRGATGQLFDSSVPPTYQGQDLYSNAGLTFLQVAERICAPWMPDPIPMIVMDHAPSRYVVAGGARGKTGLVNAWDPVALQQGILKLLRRKAGPRRAFGKSNKYYRGIDTDKLSNAKIEPGTTVWSVLQTYAKQVGCHVWSAVDGTVIVSRPCYEMDAVAAYGEGLVLKWDKALGRATYSTVRGGTVETACAERFSEYILWGVAKPNKKAKGKPVVHNGWTIKDPGPCFWARQTTTPYVTTCKLYRPKVIDAKKVADPKLLRRMAMLEMERAAIGGVSIEYEVNYHQAANGAGWAIDSMVPVHDEANDIYGPHLIVRTDLKYESQGDPPKGKTATIKVCPPEVWLPSFDPDEIADDAYLKHMMHHIWW